MNGCVMMTLLCPMPLQCSDLNSSEDKALVQECDGVTSPWQAWYNSEAPPQVSCMTPAAAARDAGRSSARGAVGHGLEALQVRNDYCCHMQPCHYKLRVRVWGFSPTKPQPCDTCVLTQLAAMVVAPRLMCDVVTLPAGGWLLRGVQQWPDLRNHQGSRCVFEQPACASDVQPAAAAVQGADQHDALSVCYTSGL